MPEETPEVIVQVEAPVETQVEVVVEPTMAEPIAVEPTIIDVEHTDGEILSPYANVPIGTETPDEKSADILKRQVAFKEKVEELVKEFQIAPQAQIQYSNYGAIPGIVLIDLKYNEGLQEHINA